ncbi:MAG: hypothetical protein JO261_12205 [Alphaproteobacteria bacterium]|nr:hypothetical protein [Alphaproteobacteria bacterium]MBV9694453.1 hypothetical protein [Alphaproteobacteria bacterium]
MKRLPVCVFAFTLPALCVLPGAVNAAPPFLIDDPGPTLDSEGTFGRGFDGTAFGVEPSGLSLSYGSSTHYLALQRMI